MKITSIADRIVVLLARKAVETGVDYTSLDVLCKEFSDIPRHQVILAVNLLREDKLLAVLDSDDEPASISLDIRAMRKMENSTLLKKGYSFAKEVRQWF